MYVCGRWLHINLFHEQSKQRSKAQRQAGIWFQALSSSLHSWIPEDSDIRAFLQPHTAVTRAEPSTTPSVSLSNNCLAKPTKCASYVLNEVAFTHHQSFSFVSFVKHVFHQSVSVLSLPPVQFCSQPLRNVNRCWLHFQSTRSVMRQKNNWHQHLLSTDWETGSYSQITL